MDGHLLPFPGRPLSAEEANAACEAILAVPVEKRADRAAELKLEEPETLLALCGYLRRHWVADPARMRLEAEFLYRYLERPHRSIGLFDEREYFLGESALVAGTCCRFLSLQADASRWFDRAEAAFRHTVNAVADWARVSYQRLALQVEERRLDEVLELLPSLVRIFEKLEMREDLARCWFLEALVLLEKDRPREALTALLWIEEAQEPAAGPPEDRAALSRLTASLKDGRVDREALGDLRRAFQLPKA